MAEPLISRPLRIGSLDIPGRVFKAATAESRASEDGYVTDLLLDFYRPMAAARTPLIISGNLFVSTSTGPWTYRQGGIDTDDKIPGLQRLTELVHASGSRIFAQISHCGRQVGGMPVEAVAPSPVRDWTSGIKPRELTVAEIHRIVEDFAAAAGRARDAGFDGVQFHMGHGYLIHGFLTPYTNRRTDRYGGSLENRMRFALEVLRETRARVGDDYPISAKYSGHDRLYGRRGGLGTPQHLEIARRLEAAGVDSFEITVAHNESPGGYMVRGRWEEFFRGMEDGEALLRMAGTAPRPPAPGMKPQIHPLQAAGLRVASMVAPPVSNVLFGYREGFNSNLARQFMQAVSIPIVSIGGWQHRAAIEEAIAKGTCDAVSIARGMIADPMIYKHMLEVGSGKPACVYCNACVGRAGGLPTDCYHPSVRFARDRMLQEELGAAAAAPPPAGAADASSNGSAAPAGEPAREGVAP